MGLTAQNDDSLYNEDKSFEVLKARIAAGLRDMEEGRTLSLEEAFNEIDKI